MGELLSVSSEVFEKITYRGAAAQYVAVVRTVILHCGNYRCRLLLWCWCSKP
ncbi:MAG: hypothetical protein IPL35_15120 [Sphingobacteriales bacterium]|nr:hypothetical protein [Sphingobacteriales bacterium]